MALAETGMRLGMLVRSWNELDPGELSGEGNAIENVEFADILRGDTTIVLPVPTVRDRE